MYIYTRTKRITFNHSVSICILFIFVIAYCRSLRFEIETLAVAHIVTFSVENQQKKNRYDFLVRKT